MADEGALAEARARLRRGARVRVRLAGGSMEPTLAQGAAVEAGPGRPRLGDVVVIDAGDALIVHRLVGVVGWGPWCRFVHLGDRPGSLPGLCRADEILGVCAVAAHPPSWVVRARATATALRRAVARAMMRP